MSLIKKLAITCPYLFSAAFCHSQEDKEDSAFFVRRHETIIHLVADSNQKKGILPFNTVKVIDARYDTSCIGFSQETSSTPIQKITFYQPASNEIENYISKIYTLAPKADSNYCLVILLEKMWLSSSIEMGNKEKGDVPVINQDAFGRQKKVKGPDIPTINNAIIIKAKIMVALDDDCHPFYQIDSVYLTAANIIRRNENQTIETAIDNTLYKVIGKSIAELKISHRVLTNSDIKAYISAKWSAPIIKAPYYNKGVYMTFEEFKNNQPSIANFEINRTSKIDILYVKDVTGNSYALRNFWGYSDGVNLYINKADNFFRLFKENNTFVLNGFNTMSKIYVVNMGKLFFGSLLYGAGAKDYTDVKYKGKKKPLQLDMDTGELF